VAHHLEAELHPRRVRAASLAAIALGMTSVAGAQGHQPLALTPEIIGYCLDKATLLAVRPWRQASVALVTSLEGFAHGRRCLRLRPRVALSHECVRQGKCMQEMMQLDMLSCLLEIPRARSHPDLRHLAAASPVARQQALPHSSGARPWALAMAGAAAM